jgi:hypothetical protein
MSAVARLALTLADRDIDGDITCNSFGEELLVKLAEGITPDFAWPPHPGSCSMVHWAPPPSAEVIAERSAATQARWAAADAKVQAEKEAREAEFERSMTPSLMTDERLLEHTKVSRKLKAIADQRMAELDGEMTRRGLA